jgi:TolB-like protein/DNA-binding winged helix-turn-helix (wHTH) protein/cytochrome c-type biogenesis protein CcmH/NrfG
MIEEAGSESRILRVDLAATPDFDLGNVRVRPVRRQLVVAGSEIRELEPRVMQVLVALAQARGEVVSRDELNDRCWDGRIVGDDSINRCILALRRLAKSIDPPPFTIETVAKVGYSLVVNEAAAPTEVRHAAPAGPESPPGTAAPAVLPPQRSWWRRAPVRVAATIVILAAILIAVWQGARISKAAEPARIAVLPFRNLAAGDSYFAEGVAEEVMGQLSREPQFRVIGRTSAAMFKNADVREVGRRLDVDYVLDGSVRSQNGRVRVNVALVNASDGIQLWSDSYDGRLDDIFAIQQRIGAATADALERKLVRAPQLDGPLVTSGEVYALYLTARGLLRSRDTPKMEAAIELLRQAIKLDPNYAPAWSSLGAATAMAGAGKEDVAVTQRRAEGYVRRALRLAPDLAEAHGALGMVLGQGSPEARAHIRRAAALDPNSAENQFWLGNVEFGEGNFDRALQAYRRASEIDPLWFVPGRSAVSRAVQMGDLREAQGYIDRMKDPHPAAMFRMRIAFERGDFSEAARIVSGPIQSSDWRAMPTRRAALGNILHLLGLPDRGLFDPEVALFRSEVDGVPSAQEWRSHNATPEDSYVNGVWNQLAVKRLLGAGRGFEVLPYFDGPTGLLGLRPGKSDNVTSMVEAAPLVALVLRQGGRAQEADRLLAEADAAMARIFRQGRVPNAFYAKAAQVWAVQGKRERALAALEQAVARGWLFTGITDLPDLAEEPAFASLRGDPRFERLRARIAAHMAKERRETAALSS